MNKYFKKITIYIIQWCINDYSFYTSRKDNLLNLASGQTKQLEEEKLGENCKPILLFK